MGRVFLLVLLFAVSGCVRKDEIAQEVFDLCWQWSLTGIDDSDKPMDTATTCRALREAISNASIDAGYDDRRD